MRKLLLGSLILPAAIFCAVVLLGNIFKFKFDAQAWPKPEKQQNTYLESVIEFPDYQTVSLGEFSEPEYWAQDANGAFYTGSLEGKVLKVDTLGDEPKIFADTQGRVLGMAFDSQQNLWVADAMKGLSQFSPAGKLIATYSDGLHYPNDVAIDKNDNVYLSDSTHASPKKYGTQFAAMIDGVEHGLQGKVLKLNKETEKFETIVEGLQFANGIVVDADSQYLYIAETGNYKVLKHNLITQQTSVLIDRLPGYPDNMSLSWDKKHLWVALIYPRSKLSEATTQIPFIRNGMNVLPEFLYPQFKHQAHILKIDFAGNIVSNYYADDLPFAKITHAVETEKHIMLGSLRDAFYTYFEK